MRALAGGVSEDFPQLVGLTGTGPSWRGAFGKVVGKLASQDWKIEAGLWSSSSLHLAHNRCSISSEGGDEWLMV